MSQNLYQIVYRSYLKPEYDSSEISSILESSHKNNPERNITGLLLYKNEVFVQIIEGQEHDLRYLYDKIGRDQRHEDMKILWEQEVPERTFSSWSMAFKDLSEAPQDIVDQYGSLLNQDFDPGKLVPSDGLKLFASLKATL